MKRFIWNKKQSKGKHGRMPEKSVCVCRVVGGISNMVRTDKSIRLKATQRPALVHRTFNRRWMASASCVTAASCVI